MGGPIVLCYHAVSESWPADLAVTPGRFERQLSSLVKQGYRGATFREAVQAPPGSKLLAVTFDDAYRSVIEHGFPVLRRLGLAATLFVPTAFPGHDGPMVWPGIDDWLGGPYEDELTPMSWSEIAVLADAGWEIGAHTHSHPRLVDLNDEALAYELAVPRRICEERLGVSCTSLAYPYGVENPRVVEAALLAGYSAAGSLPDSFHSPSPMHWPRVGVYRADGMLRFRVKTSPTMMRLRANGRFRVPPRAWAVLRRLRGPSSQDRAARSKVA
jgi:peptidoglycan/xylan/chitin deacetylase (PgdA/CDA1 family)